MKKDPSVSKHWKAFARGITLSAVFSLFPMLASAQTSFEFAPTDDKEREVEKMKMEAFLGGDVQAIPYASDFQLSDYTDIRKKVGNFVKTQPLSSHAALYESVKNHRRSQGIDDLEIEATISNLSWGAIFSADDNKQMFLTIEPDPSPVIDPDMEMALYTRGLTITYYDDSLQPIKDFYVKMNDTTYTYSVVAQYSKNYFNFDNKLEFMVYAHSFGQGDGPAACRDTVFIVNEDGEVLSKIGNAIGIGLHKVKGDFMDEKRVQVFNAFYSTLHDTIYSSIYNSLNFNENSNPIHTFKIPEVLTTYMEGPYYDLVEIDGENYYLGSQYEKPFILNNDQEEFVVDKTNRFHVYLYDTKFNLQKEFILPLIGIEENQFSMSSLIHFGDYRITRTMFNADDKFEILYGMSRYYADCDCEKLQFYIMDEDGNIIEEIADGLAGVVRLQDLPGQEEEYALLVGGGTSLSEIIMYDLKKRKENVRFQAIHNGDLLTSSFERVPVADGDYQYVFGMARGETTATTVYGGIGHYDRQGNLVKKVRIELSGRSLFFEPILTAETLNPYSFIPDEKMEYIYFRRDQGDDGMSLESVFGIADEEKTLYMWKSDSENGSLSGAGVRSNEDRTTLRNLYVTYSGMEGYKTTFYKLPLEKVVLEGEGTKASPYLIHNPVELDMVREYPEAYFELANDIDMASFTGVNASGFTSIPSFKGHLDGKNHFIRNMTITGTGIFARMEKGSSVKNLLVKNVTFKDIHGNTGVIAGQMEGSTVFNCHVETDIVSDVELSYYYVGGLVGQATTGASISHSSFNGKIDLPNVVQVGGIAGTVSTDSRLTNSISEGEVRGLNYVGGLVGITQSGSLIGNSYSSMDVTGAMGVGGIIGSNQARVENVYSDGLIRLEELPNALYVGKAAGIAGETAVGMQGTGFITQSFALNDTIMGIRELARVAYITSYVDWMGRVAMDSNYGLSTMLLGADEESLAIANDTNCALNRRNGLSGTLDEFNQEYYEKAGWKFGNDSIQPWVFSGQKPRLWYEFEVRGVELPHSEVVLKKDSTYTILPRIFPADATDKTVLYSSSDNSIASVNQQGVVKGINPGLAEITVRTVDGGYTAICKVEVVIPVEKVVFKEDTVYMAHQGIYRLEASVFPENATNKSLLFRSLDDNTVQVYGSTIAGVNLGETQVVVVSEDGEASDTCTVIVASPTTAIYLNETDITLDAEHPQFQLEVSVYPANSIHGDLIWSSRDESVATVSSTGLVSAGKKGETVIDVKISGTDISANCTVGVSENVGNGAMEEGKVLAYIQDGSIEVSAPSYMRSLQLFNLHGQLLYSRLNLQSRSARIPVQGLSEGVYLLRIIWTDGSSHVVKVIR